MRNEEELFCHFDNKKKFKKYVVPFIFQKNFFFLLYIEILHFHISFLNITYKENKIFTH